jgi:hypothetical protein
MELKINIGYAELFELIKQLPKNELSQLRVDLKKISSNEIEKSNEKNSNALNTQEKVKNKVEDKQKMIDFILSYSNNQPSFGDALIWQNQERTDRELPSFI